jgi:hypothetical protein
LRDAGFAPLPAFVRLVRKTPPNLAIKPDHVVQALTGFGKEQLGVRLKTLFEKMVPNDVGKKRNRFTVEDPVYPKLEKILFDCIQEELHKCRSPRVTLAVQLMDSAPRGDKSQPASLQVLTLAYNWHFSEEEKKKAVETLKDRESELRAKRQAASVYVGSFFERTGCNSQSVSVGDHKFNVVRRERTQTARLRVNDFLHKVQEMAHRQERLTEILQMRPQSLEECKNSLRHFWRVWAQSRIEIAREMVTVVQQPIKTQSVKIGLVKQREPGVRPLGGASALQELERMHVTDVRVEGESEVGETEAALGALAAFAAQPIPDDTDASNVEWASSSDRPVARRKPAQASKRHVAFASTAEVLTPEMETFVRRESGSLRRDDGGSLRRDDGGSLRRDDGGSLRRDDGGSLRRDESGSLRRDESGSLRRDDGGMTRKDDTSSKRSKRGQ